MQALEKLEVPVEETTYLAIGGGLGSFAWVNHLVIYGVDPAHIVSIGFEPKPYGRYKRLCENSQIPKNERLRSDSGATPDNIWGWPGYAVREIWDDLKHLKLGHAAYICWQIFTEPVFAEPFTPKSGDVYASIDREARRIGWKRIWRHGRVRTIRQTDDGRYAVVYSQSKAKRRAYRIIIAPYIHVAIGYPGLRFLPDLQAYREQTGDFKQVVNAYENHNHVYEQLRQQGGTVLVRGRGIVASRIIQRLYEERHKNPQIAILHLMRSPIPEGTQYRQATRLTEQNLQFQPYNFPKACFGGDLRDRLEKASEEERQKLIDIWGGTTTANRSDWRMIIKTGLQEGWYQAHFGQLERIVSGPENKLLTRIKGRGLSQVETHLQADFVIDATGLNPELEDSPLLKDLLQSYGLEKNALGRLRVAHDFEITGLRNQTGRIYASGTITLGGPFGPVDSFVGLQYAAQRSVNSLARLQTPGLRPMNISRSVNQWLRWVEGVKP